MSQRRSNKNNFAKGSAKRKAKAASRQNSRFEAETERLVEKYRKLGYDKRKP